MHSGCVLSSLPTNRFACDNPYHHTFTRRNRRQRTRMMMRCFPLLEVPGIARLEMRSSQIHWSWAFGDTSITSKWWWNLAPRGMCYNGVYDPPRNWRLVQDGGYVERWWPWATAKLFHLGYQPTTQPPCHCLPPCLRWAACNVEAEATVPFLSPSSLANSSLKTPN